MKKLAANIESPKVNFIGSIDRENVLSFLDKIKKITEENPDSSSITIYISSPGGNVDIAVELFNFLRLLDSKVTTVNVSCVNSAAIVVFAAGEKRISLPCSSFYVHSISKNLSGDFTAKDLLREVKEMTTNTDKVATILAGASNKDKSYWKRLMGKGCLLTSSKAKELGLVHDISEHK